MTRGNLILRLGAVVVLLCAYVAAAIALKFSGEQGFAAFYEVLRDFIPIVIGLGATFVADTLQRRGQFIAALRDLWYEMVRTKGEMMAYLRSANGNETQFIDAWTAQSDVIDMVRGVYRNVGETKALVGLRPFEPLIGMLHSFEKVDPRKDKAASAFAETAVEVESHWNALREVFLDEFGLPEPEASILVPNAKRRKRRGASLLGQTRLQVQKVRYRN